MGPARQPDDAGGPVRAEDTAAVRITQRVELKRFRATGTDDDDLLERLVFEDGHLVERWVRNGTDDSGP